MKQSNKKKSCKSLLQLLLTTCIVFISCNAFGQYTETSKMDNIFMLTPSPNTLKAVSNELFMIHFRNNVTTDTSGVITIYNENGTVFEEVKLNSKKIIDVQSRRIIFDASNDFVVDSNYYINFSSDVFSDSTSIVDDTIWAFTCGLQLKEVLLYSPAIKDSFRLMIGLPEDYSVNTDSTYLVAYITDGGFFCHGQHSAIANGGALNETADYITVGIAYPKKYTINDVRGFRGRDLRSSPDNLLNFINDSIIPYIDLNYRTKPGENTLIGNSHGGRFAVHVLTSYRENNNFQFKNIFAVAHIDAFTTRVNNLASVISDLPVNFYNAIGGADNSDRIWGYNHLNNNLISRQYPSFGFEFKIYEGLPHGEVSATAAFYDAFRVKNFTKLWPYTPPSSISLIKSNSLKVNVFPNPVSDILNVNIQNDELKDINVYLYNSIGILKHKDNLKENNYSLNVNQFSKGLYLLLIESEDDIVAKKIMIE